MNAEPQALEASPVLTSVWAKMLNLLVSPSQVFEEVIAGSPKLLNWLIPAALVALSSLFVLNQLTSADQTAAGIAQLMDGTKISQEQSSAMPANWQKLSCAFVLLGPFVGTFWAGSVLWIIGRYFLKSHVQFAKALEIAGLTSAVCILGNIVTWLLVLATGDPTARPALSLLLLSMDHGSTLRAGAEVLNAFHLWSAGILAIGLARLSRVSVFEACFWVFGYWIVARIALVMLG